MNAVYPVHKAPYTNFHDLNLDWIMENMAIFTEQLQNFVALNTIKYANPFQWDITSQYAQNTLVIDTQSGTAYLSVQPVPQGVQISNTDYWTSVFTLQNFTDSIKTAIADNIPQQENGQAATQTIPAQSVFFVGDVLCYNPAQITNTSLVVIGSNCVQVSIMDIIIYILQQTTDLTATITAEQTAREEADTQLSQQITAEQTAREQADTQLSQQITAEQTARTHADQQLQNEIDALSMGAGMKNRKFIFVTDSYGLTPTEDGSWTSFIAQYLGIDSSAYTIKAASGAGFGVTNGEQYLFQNIVQSISVDNPSSITDIVFVCGYNDIPFTTGQNTPSENSVKTGIRSTVAYLTNMYQNAAIHLFFAGCSTNGEVCALRAKAVRWYSDECAINPKMQYAAGSDQTLHQKSYMAGDAIHPSTDGSEAIARCVAMYLKTGAVNVYYNTTPQLTFTLAGGYWAVQPIMGSSLNNGYCTFALSTTGQHCQFIFTEIPITANSQIDITLGSIADTTLFGGEASNTVAAAIGFSSRTDDPDHLLVYMSGTLFVKGCNLHFAFTAPGTGNLSGIILQPCTVVGTSISN